MCKCEYCDNEIVIPSEVVRYGSAFLHADCHEAMNEEIHAGGVDCEPRYVDEEYIPSDDGDIYGTWEDELIGESQPEWI